MDVNDAGCRALGRARDRLKTRPFSEWVLPGDRRRTGEALEMVLEGRRAEWQTRVRGGDGLPRLHRIQGSPLLRGGSVEGVLIFLQSFTETGDARPEARQLQNLLENLPGQFVVLADRDGRIRYSAGLGRTHFRDNTSVLGARFRDLLGTERQGEENLRALLESVGDGKSWAGVQWHRRKDGVSFPVEIFASPYVDPRSGQCLGALIVGRDLSPARKWKDLAEEAGPLARIGSLTGRISEEMRDGLDRLEEAIARGFEPDAGGGRGSRIKQELHRLQRFLAGIAEFGERVTPRPSILPMAERTHQALERASGRMASLGIQPLLEVPPNLPPVFADEAYVDRILDILLENALDALQESPIPLLRVELKNGADGVILSMTNSGSTVREDWLGEIFDPFFTTRDGHSGLGLAVVQGMMEAHGGRIWAKLPQEGFLTLVLEFPREAPDRVMSFRPVPLNLSRPRTVLVVDDDEAIRGTLRSFLEKVGYDVREAWSGRSALAQLTSGRLPEVVLTDLKMSDGSGYWLLDELRRDFPALVQRTVIVTGNVDHETAVEVASESGCPLLRKPFELPDLLEILDQVILEG